MNKNVKAMYRLTSMQEGMLFHNMIDDDSANYHVQNSFWINEEIDIDLIKKSLKLLSYRHDVFRTVFLISKSTGVPWQVVMEDKEIEMNQYFCKDNKAEEFIELVKNKDLNKRFNLQKDSLLRLTIMTFENNRHLFMFSFHHIIMDGWCLSLAFGDLLRYYSMFQKGMSFQEVYDIVKIEKNETSEYGDYLKWLEKQDKIEALKYFKNVLIDYENVAEVKPMLNPKHSDKSVEKIGIDFSEEETRKLKELAIANKVTINSALEAAWGVVLQKLNYTDDVVFGKVVSGRNVPIKGIERIVGLFVNTIPFRVKSTDCDVNTLLKTVYEQGIKSNDYEYCSLAEVQNLTVQGTDLIKTLFVFENFYVDENNIKMNGDDNEVKMESAREETNYDLTVLFSLENKKLNCSIMYDPNKYIESEIRNILCYIKQVLNFFTEHNCEKIMDFELITEDMKQLILGKFNNNKTEYPSDKTVINLFEEQVFKTPDNIAIVFDKDNITYNELNNKANMLANKLLDYGVRNGDFVAILANRSVEVIVGILATLKVGAAYVPIDPKYPEDRIQYIIKDCNPKVMLIYKANIDTYISVIDLSEEFDSCEKIKVPSRIDNADSLAYCIYTSGTTGKPKGVLIENRSIVRLVKNTNYIVFDENSIVMQTGSMAFDASTFEVWGPLLNGGRLVLASKDVITNKNQLKEYLSNYKVNTMWLTSTLFNQMIQIDNAMFDSLKYLLIGGEKLSETHVAIMKSRNNNVKLINGYGPTENTTFTTTYEIPNDFKTIPIGKPIANTQVYIMNKGKLCGIGVPGELCIAGDGLSRGYLNESELNKEKFVSNPFGKGKLYYSGDLARWIQDGNIEYISRIDEQVKIRGFRIELDEIDKVIRKINFVKDAAVIVKTDKNGDKAIYAYIVSDKKISAAKIKEILGNSLPDYMIPSYIAQIDEIPVTNNGKLDKRALPDIKNRSEREYVEPRNDIEAIVCRVFEEVLNIEKVGIKDDFFELGGHSLRATRAVNRIEAETSAIITLKDLFKLRTVEKISDLIRNASDNEYEHIPKAEQKNYYKMSSAQKRIYLICEMDTSSISYNMPNCLRIKGEINAEKMRKAIISLIKRHEILRTVFIVQDGEPVQVIKDSCDLDFEYINDNRSKEEVINNFVKPFDLSKGPLFRIKVIRDNDSSLILFDSHHIISDGMSMEIIIKELLNLYYDERLEDIPCQYKDYSEWMLNRDLSSQREYWLKEFEDEIPVLDMPLDFKRPVEQSFRGETVSLSVNEKEKELIKNFVNKTKTTEYMLFLASAMILLSKYSRQDDIVIGSPISGRTHRDTENILGMFVNTLALRGKPNKDKKFSEFLEEVKNSCIKAYDNQDYPFEELIEDIDIQRDISRNPLFDVMLAVQNNERVDLVFNNEKAEYINLENNIAKFDLTFNIYENAKNFNITLDYCTDLYKKLTAESILKHFKYIIMQVIDNPEILISDIKIATEIECNEIIKVFNNTYSDYPKNTTVHELFEEQVKKTPENLAIIFKDKKLTYKELNEKANKLAIKLREKGVKADSVVAIIAEKSIEMIIGIIATLKAGGAYLPIDSEYPLDRIEYILEDSKPLVLLGKVNGINKINFNGSVLDINKEIEGWEDCPNIKNINVCTDLAYIIYTSGTTGKPKGVLIENRNIVRLVKNTNYIVFDENSILMQTGSMAFDASTFEVWGPLLNGGRLVLASKDVITNKNQLKEYLSNYKVNTLWLTSALFNQMIQTDNAMFDNLKYLLTGGEKISETHVAIMKSRNNNVKLINCYGPTENTTFTTTYEIPNDFKAIPIGKPIANTQVYIIDNGNLCGIGVPGELCISGDGLARGYLNNKKLTNEKFVPNPYKDNEKMYRSGDLVRWLEDGNIEFLGRIDEQVKIRGFRIELAEIENVIRRTNLVSNVCVICKTYKNDEKRLLAYVVGSKDIDVDLLKEMISKELPEYMMPYYIMQIDAIPTTVNGKIDKKRLPEIEIKSQEKFVYPEDETEELVCRIFSEVLDVDKVSVIDNFFSIGGHSLKAIKVVNKIEEECKVRILFKDVFEYKTARGLAKCIKNYEGKKINDIEKAEEKKYYLMSATQRRIYLIQKLNEDSTSYNMPEFFKINGDVNVLEFKNALIKMIERHEVLRTEFLILDGEPVQKIKDYIEPDFAFEENNNHIKNIMRDFVKPFKLEEGNTIRIKIVKNNNEYYLFIDMHHIVSDGMSMAIFVNEFSRIYKGESLDEVLFQYKDYSEWMRKRDLTVQKKYWQDVFNDEIHTLYLPYDFKRSDIQSFEGAEIIKYVNSDFKKMVKKFCEETEITEYMLMLSSLMILLSKYSYQDDVIIGSPIAARTNSKTENMLGVFINTLALRGNPSNGKTIKEFLMEMKNICLKSYENQEYPFEELVENINVQRDISRNPLFDVMFVLQNNDKLDLSIDGIELNVIESEHNTSKFDLTVSVEEFEDGYNLGLEYCTKLFKEDTVRSICDHYIEIIKRICADPDKKIGEIDLLIQDEKNKIINEFNNTSCKIPTNKTIVELFEEQVLKEPNKVAAVFEDKEITYAQLNEKANIIAHKLRNLGVKPNEFVGIVAERSLEMLIGVYGIIKSGGTYVPIDKDYPKERIDYILNDCKPKAIIVYDADVESSIPIINLKDSNNFHGKIDNPERINKPEDLLYCIYTSGTTGNPKGVMIKHSCVVNYSINTEYATIHGIKENNIKVMACVTNLVFDICVTEIITTILNGIKVIIANKLEQENAEYFEEYVLRNCIEAIQTTPSRIKLFMENKSKNKYFDKLKYIMLGGEKVEADLIKNIRKYSNAIIVNVYGPSETTVWSTMGKIEESDVETIFIGKPITNTQVYILNEKSLCGIGMPGELCIAGEGVAAGYLNREDLTKQKFISNPYGKGKLYKTGDLAKWSKDGKIECLGRIDDQIKIRGFRIELGEIQNVIENIDYIKNAAVIVRKDKMGENAICAYVVSDEKVNVSELRSAIGKKLPEYMVPSYILQISNIPINKNGKLDRKALPIIEARSQRLYEAPTNELEKIICEAFEKVLNLERVGINDDFFEIGGHSLRATRVINDIEEKIGVRIPMKAIFENRTPKLLSEYIKENDQEIQYKSIPKAEEKEFYQMSSTQKRSYLLWQMNKESISYNMPSCYKLTGEIDKNRAFNSLRKIEDRHEILRTVFMMKDGEFVQKVLDYIEVDFKYIETNDMSDSKLMEKFIKPFDLEKGPLFRMELVKRNNEYLLFFDMHHIIGDGMSMGILIKEIAQIYNNETLNPIRIQYKDYSEWMNSRDLSIQKDYWLQEFKGELPVLNLPIDYPRKKEKSFNGAKEKMIVSSEIKNNITKLTEMYGVTEYMVYLSSAMILLSKYSGQEDIIIGSPISGRIHIDMEDMLGMFVNTLAMRGNVKSCKKYNEFLGEIKEKSLRAYENQEYPFEELVENVAVKRDLSRNPLFDVLLVLQNNEEVLLNLDGTKAVFNEVNTNSSKFDLTFSIMQSEDSFEIQIEYCSDLFKAETVKKILCAYERILNKVTETSDIKIGDIEILSEKEKNLILREFNSKIVPYNNEENILDIFEKQVALNSDKVALNSEKSSLTYYELNRKANILANKLIDFGVKKNSNVVVIIERSEMQIVALLATLKAGATYVPVDPNYPNRRIKDILVECNPEVICVCNTAIKTDKIVIDLNDSKLFDYYDGKNVHVKINPLDVMYCTYTIGTEGKPKCTKNTYRGMYNLLMSISNEYELKCEDTYLIKSVVTSNINILESLLWFMSGGKAIIGKKNIEKDVDILIETINKYKITIVNCTSTMVSLINKKLNNNDLNSLNSLRYLFVYGERININVIKKIYTNLKSKGIIDIVYFYGQNETGIYSTSKVINEQDINISIGKPMNNINVYIVNKNDNSLCNVGICGEICISGYGVGSGYLNNDTLTNSKFIDNPYSNGKWYRTGDLGRYLPNGEIECLGRISESTSEFNYNTINTLESIIRNIEHINNVAIKVYNNKIGIYFTADEEVDDVKFKSICPYPILQIEEFPINQYGKLDYKRLPSITNDDDVAEYEEPRTKEEKLICKLLEEVLNIDRVGINDNFFEIEGDSLKAMKLVAKIRENGYRVSINDILNYPIVKEFCTNFINNRKYINDKLIDNNKFGINNIQNFDEAKEYLDRSIDKYKNMIFKGNIVNSYKVSEVQRLTTKMNLMKSGGITINFEEDLDMNLLTKSILALINSQSLLRSIIIKKEDTLYINEYEKIEDIEISYLDISNTEEKLAENIKRYITEDIYSKCSSVGDYIYNSLLYRIIVVKDLDKKYVVYMPFSHVIFDGMSMEILKSKLLRGYYNNGVIETSENEASYEEYIAQINAGPKNIKEKDIYDKFNLGKFFNAYNKYIEFDRNSLVNANIKVKLNKKADEYDKDVLWDISYKIFINILKYHFDSEVIPFAIYTIGRQYENKNYYGTIGEFLDIIPAIESYDSNNNYYYFRDLMKYASENNLHFITLLFNQNLKERFPTIQKEMKKINDGFMEIPIFNFLGLYEDKIEEVDEENIDVDMLDKTVRMIIGMYFKDDNIMIQTFCYDGEELILTEVLQNALENILSKL